MASQPVSEPARASCQKVSKASSGGANGQVVRVVDEADYLSALVEEGQKVIADKAAG
jgi:hypothetical protein